MPGNNMLCADSDVANVVVNESGSIRFYHPNPQHYDYEVISVSDTDAEPRIIQAEQ